MVTLAKSFLLLSTVLVLGCASPQSVKSFDSAIGEWSWQLEARSDQWYGGKMTIIDETKATYTYQDGRIYFYAIDDQGKWEGYWVENSGARKCSDKMHGSNDWGVATFQFSDAYNEFTGKWNFCGEGKELEWNGAR